MMEIAPSMERVWVVVWLVRSAGESGQTLGTGGAQLYSLEAGKVQSLREFGES